MLQHLRMQRLVFKSFDLASFAFHYLQGLTVHFNVLSDLLKKL